jgi:hypothetical protein
MRRADHFAWCVIGFTVMVMATGVRAATAQDGLHGSVTVRIHDYAEVPQTTLARASNIVCTLYQTIGVQTEWLPTFRPNRSRGAPDGRPIATLTMILLTPEMAARGHIPSAVLGYAAAPQSLAEAPGHIAYVIYDRVVETAHMSSADAVELLGIVMAHEIGHLLLAAGSHVERGLMRGRWEYQDIRYLDGLGLAFSDLQANQIREVVDASGPTPTRLNTPVAHD